MRFRVLVISLGFILVALTYTFPLWVDVIMQQSEAVIFPELDEAQRAAFVQLPQERQEDYLVLRDRDPQLAYRLAVAALQDPVAVPLDEQENPNAQGQIPVLTGEFISITPNRSATGTATIYELPDGSRYLWLEDFSAIPAPGLRLFLTRATRLTLDELNSEENEELALTANDLLLDPLRAQVGNQAYDIPREAVLEDYDSVMIFSTELNLVWSLAELN
jgi:hypothetical protein